MSLMQKIENLVISPGDAADGPKADVCEPGETPLSEDLDVGVLQWLQSVKRNWKILLTRGFRFFSGWEIRERMSHKQYLYTGIMSNHLLDGRFKESMWKNAAVYN